MSSHSDPPAGQDQDFETQPNLGRRPTLDPTALRQASATALARELWIIQQAARQVANYHALPHEDYERVDQAAGHVLAVLAMLMDQEVTLEL